MRSGLCRRARPAALEEIIQALYLFAATKLHQFRGNGSFGAAEHRLKITNAQRQSPENVGFLGHLIRGTRQMPQRMTSQRIILSSSTKSSHERGALRGAYRSMM